MPNKRGYYQSGWIGGIFLLILNLLSLVPGLTFFAWVSLFASVFIFFFVARSAGMKRLQDQRARPRPLEGVNSTAIGAVMISLAISVSSMILEAILIGLVPAMAAMGLVSLCWMIPSQIVIGLAVGVLSASLILKSYQTESHY